MPEDGEGQPDRAAETVFDASSKNPTRRMDFAQVQALLDECSALIADIREAANKRRRSEVNNRLIDLAVLVRSALSTANEQFQDELIPLLVAIAKQDVAALLDLASRENFRVRSLRRELLSLRNSITARVTTARILPYNPLELTHLAESTWREFDKQNVCRLSDLRPFIGTGVYALYYDGDFPLYKAISDSNRNMPGSRAIYVGEAGRQGKRKGVGFSEESADKAIYDRLVNSHSESIRAAENLKLEDFSCRYLVIQDLFVPLCESILIEKHVPLWNRLVDGFGNKAVGGPRERQKIAPWDMLHPGRPKRATGANDRFPIVEVLAEAVRKLLSGDETVPLLSLEEAAEEGSEGAG